MRKLRHGKIDLALHDLRDGDGGGRPLLLLHGLGERSPDTVPAVAAGWPGPVHALDFTGHGDSTIPLGGGYSSEVLMGDADSALASLGPATLLGRGLGAYVALLLAGSRPRDVRGAVLSDGPGLFGGPTGPSSPSIVTPTGTDPPVAPDPYALVELTRDIRPPDYASSFARQAAHLSGLRVPLVVSAIGRPPWLDAVVTEVGVKVTTVEKGLALFAAGAD